MSNSSNIDAGSKILKRAVFLFGAGATKDAGCLVSSEMLDDIYEMELSRPEIDAIDFLLSSLQYHASWKNLKERISMNSANGHQPNIEDLMLLIRRVINRDSYLPFPITGSWADKINFLEIEWRSTDSYQNTIAKKSLFVTIEEKLTRRLSHWLKLGNESTNYLNPISEFLQETEDNSSPLSFFTLNYDLVFEKHFNKDAVTLLYNGFLNGSFSGFHSSLIQQNRINYYKLHGSINWERDESGLIKESFNYSDDDGLINLKDTKDAMNKLKVSEFVQNSIGNPHIIFGQGGKFLSVDPFISLLYNFKELLNEKDIFFVIGYSFFDPYINNMLLEGLSKDVSRLMIVVNPQFNEKDYLTSLELMKSEQEKGEIMRNRFIDHLQRVQKSTYLSDLPGFNLTDISPNKIKILSIKTADFLMHYFSPSAEGFINFNDDLNRIEEEANVF